MLTLGIVAPASAIDDADLDRGIEALHEMGFQTRLLPHVLERNGHLAGTDAERAADLHEAFADPAIDAVLCARGGYGVSRILRYLDLDGIAEIGKPFLGYSDVTVLHTALNRRGLVTYHAPMVVSFAQSRPDWVRESFIAALKGEDPIPPDAPGGEIVIPGSATGPVGGGCLSLLADSLGTHEAFDGADQIVLLEDIGENTHRIDALLTHLLNAGALQNAKAFVVGEMTDTPDWQPIVEERLAPLGKPLIVRYPFGHIDAMLTLPLGRTATLEEGRLRYE